MEPVESSHCKVYDSKTCQVLQKTSEMFLPLIFSKLQKKIAELSQRQNSGASWVNLLDWFSLPSYQVPHTDVEGLRFLSCTDVKQSLFLLSVNFWFGCADNWRGEGFLLLRRAD